MDSTKEIIKQQIDECLSLLKNTLGDDLLGFYLYGSSLLGGLQKFSDIDLLAISNRETTREEKERIGKALLNISGIYGVSHDRKPIELTIVVKSEINPWNYPPKFDFLYGDWMRKDFESGNVEPWPTKVLPNLALVITQLLLSNKILIGPSPDRLLSPVPYQDFYKATTAEIDSLMRDIDTDTRNVLLTLSRIWFTLETDTINSKSAAATWVINKLPDEYKPVMTRAKAISLGENEERWGDLKEIYRKCAELMIAQIKSEMSLIQSTNFSARKIKISN